MKISAVIRWSALVALLMTIGIFIWAACVAFEPFELRSPEPQYQGKKLTEWAREIDQSDFFRLPAYQQHPKQNAEAIAAIQHIGTNALPAALELCRAQDPWLRTAVLRRVEQWVDKYNSNIEEYNQDYSKDQWHSEIHFNFVWADEKHSEGCNIVWALGSLTKPIIPDLVQLLKSDDRDIVADAMFFTLAGAGTNAIPPLLELLKDGNSEVRLRAAIALASFFIPQKPAKESNGSLIVPGSENFRTPARATIPVLLAGLENRELDLITRLQVIQALGLIHEDASTVAPILFRHIQKETNTTLLRTYSNALENFIPPINFSNQTHS
jgi:HEAT repeat protein